MTHSASDCQKKLMGPTSQLISAWGKAGHGSYRKQSIHRYMQGPVTLQSELYASNARTDLGNAYLSTGVVFLVC